MSGSKDLQKALAGWLKSRLLGTPRVERFELFHLVTGKDPELLVVVDRPELKPDEASKNLDDAAADVAREFAQAANDTAQCYEGRQRFSVSAFGANERRVGGWPFQIGDGRSMATVDPTDKGIMIHILRQNTELHRLGPTLLESAARINEVLSAHVVEAENTRLRYVRLSEELESQKIERQIAEMRAESEERRRDRWMAVFEKLAPEAFEQAKGYLAGKQLASGKGGAADLAKAHDLWRRVWAVLEASDKRAIEASLDAERRQELDNLLGVGVEFKDLTSLRNAARWVLAGIEPALADKLIDFLTKNHPALGLEFKKAFFDAPESQEQASSGRPDTAGKAAAE